jgi:hypothetical protein
MRERCFMDTPMNEGMPSRVSDTMVKGVLTGDESSTGGGELATLGTIMGDEW